MKIKEFIDQQPRNISGYVKETIDQWIEDQGDITELARQLYSTIGHTINIEGQDYQVTEQDIQQAIDEWKASRKLCTSGKPNSALGASALSSCKAQGYRRREGNMSHKIGKRRVKMGGKKIRGKKYGGPVPDWSE